MLVAAVGVAVVVAVFAVGVIVLRDAGGRSSAATGGRTRENRLIKDLIAGWRSSGGMQRPCRTAGLSRRLVRQRQRDADGRRGRYRWGVIGVRQVGNN
jgi:hypothetical protein